MYQESTLGRKRVERGSLHDVADSVRDTTREESAPLNSAQTYEFCGKHLIASYSGCRMDRLEDKSGVDSIMRRAIVASGATVLDAALHVFPEAGMTYVYVLAESHASIHTYPEHASCFVDIFTCGYECDPLEFDAVLTEHFQPERVSRQLILRGDANALSLEHRRERGITSEDPGQPELNLIAPAADQCNSRFE
ncbi:MAG: adenosylmethionine decarboxylase [Cyanobacteria bacterium]|nr:adenosylmethionine decarboxylase [Cyanobacteriota bacterium]